MVSQDKYLFGSHSITGLPTENAQGKNKSKI
jgi:hypothetical protein